MGAQKHKNLLDWWTEQTKEDLDVWEWGRENRVSAVEKETSKDANSLRE